MSHNMLTSGPHLFPECFHSRSIHKDHKLSPIGNPLGKFGIDARCRQMKIQAEKDRVGRGYHVRKIFFFFFENEGPPRTFPFSREQSEPESNNRDHILINLWK